MKVTSKKTIDFPKYNWGVRAGEERELPKDKEAAEAIQSNRYVSVVKPEAKSQKPRATN